MASAVIGRSRRDRTEILRREASFVIAAYPLEAVIKPSITPLPREVLFHSSLVTYFLDFPATRRFAVNRGPAAPLPYFAGLPSITETTVAITLTRTAGPMIAPLLPR